MWGEIAAGIVGLGGGVYLWRRLAALEDRMDDLIKDQAHDLATTISVAQHAAICSAVQSSFMGEVKDIKVILHGKDKKGGMVADVQVILSKLDEIQRHQNGTSKK